MTNISQPFQVTPNMSNRNFYLSACLWAMLVYAIAALAGHGLSSQNSIAGSLDDIIILEDFESCETGSLPSGWLQMDGDGGYSTWFQRPSTWQVLARENFDAHSGTKTVMCHFNNNALANDDWLILPQCNATGTITLSYWAASQDPGYLESYEVRISTTGTAPENFTNLVYSNTSVPAQWTLYTHDLSAYSDTPFHIAFHYNAVDRFALKLDDIALDGTPLTGTISGYVTDDSARAVRGAEVRILSLNQSARTDTGGRYTLSLIPEGTYLIRFEHEFFQSANRNGITVAIGETTAVNVSLVSRPLEFFNFRSAGLPRPITDFDTTNAYIIISDTLIVYDLDVTVSIIHPFIGDLKLWLLSPDTTIIPLAAVDPFNNSQNMTECRFDDEAELPFTAGTAPYTGHWQPLQPLNVVDGDSSLLIRGAQRFRRWDLFVYDSSAQDEGQLTGFTIEFVSEMGEISGIVRTGTESNPIEGVQVYATGRRTRDTTYTNASGNYSLSRVGMGIHSVTFVKEGYDTVRIDGVAVYAGDTYPLDVAMTSNVGTNDFQTIARAFHFEGNYPNPFNGQTEFRFSLAKAGLTQLKLYNILGQEAASVVDQSLEAGNYRISYDAAGLPSGLYFAELASSGNVEIRKVMLLR